MANPHLRQVLDAEANAATNGGILYPNTADAQNSSDLLHIISEFASRTKFAFENVFFIPEEEAGGHATASIQDSNGDFPDPTGIGESAGVQTIFTTGNPALFPISSYGETIGVIGNAGLRHYHHSIQMGLAIDGLYVSFPTPVVVDYMNDNVTGTGTGAFRDEIQAAGRSGGTWDIDNISLGDLRGIEKPVPTISGPQGLQLEMTNIVIGDPSNTSYGAGNFQVTGYSAYDNTGAQYGLDENTQNIRVGGGF